MVVLEVLHLVGVTSSVHVGVGVGGEVVESTSVGEHSEGSISQLLVVTVVWLVVGGEPENKVPVSVVVTSPSEPTSHSILVWECLVSSSDLLVLFLSLSGSDLNCILDLRDH